MIKEGFWFDGCLERKGRIDSPRGDTYVGDFRRGRFEGRGKFQFKEADENQGFYRLGYRDGPSEFLFGNAKPRLDNATGKTVLDHDHEYHGYWRVGKSVTRGLFATVSRDDPKYFFSTNNRNEKFPYLSILQARADKLERKWKRRYDRRQEEDHLRRKKVYRYNRRDYLNGRYYIQLVVEDEKRRIKKEVGVVERAVRQEWIDWTYRSLFAQTPNPNLSAPRLSSSARRTK